MAPTKKPPQQQQSLLSFFNSQGSVKSKPTQDHQEVTTEKLAVKEEAKVISAKQKRLPSRDVSKPAPGTATAIINSSPGVPVSVPNDRSKWTDNSKMDTDSDDDNSLAATSLVSVNNLRVKRMINMFCMNRIVVENALVIRIYPKVMKKQKPQVNLL